MRKKNDSAAGIIYKITHKESGKVYIGQTVKTADARWKMHCSDTNRGCDTYFHNAVRKYGPEAFEVETLATVPKSFLNSIEVLYIQLFAAQNRDIGYNSTAGGDGGDTNGGKKLSDETKAKIRAGHVGKTLTAEHRALLSQIHANRPRTEKELVSLAKRREITAQKNKVKRKHALIDSFVNNVCNALHCRLNNIIAAAERARNPKPNAGRFKKGDTSWLKGGHLPQEQKDNLSRSMKEQFASGRRSCVGYKHSEETRAKARGRKASDETKAKIVAALIARGKAKEETRAKMSASHRRVWEARKAEKEARFDETSQQELLGTIPTICGGCVIQQDPSMSLDTQSMSAAS